ncbi:hypothetical protein [Cellulosimicrobium sp. CUA-896]|uniref:hypothetical protein n=1 Tax=Cellulosimicrobium sp. CUA-896 TaxID=1517881 RepID=UPI0009677BC8|nr:hypothetical protein [Cellulosimicrobium sp. CUA-896]OLT54631.1 hypothetical protein BJF88_07930 [Cellulosimicrobium sp. CUA-896]
MLSDAIRRWDDARLDVAPDAPLIDLVMKDAGAKFSVVWAGEGFPADIDAALRSARMADILPSTSTPLVVARHMSPGAVAVLEERGVSWVDETGRASVHAEPGIAIVIDRERSPTENLRPLPRSSRWAPGTAAVAETVLVRAARLPDAHAEPLPSVTRLAADAGVSTALASRALQGFDAEGWTSKSGASRGPRAARTLSDPSTMLSSWASWHAEQVPSRIGVHAVVDDPDRFVRDRLAPQLRTDDWALTGWLALQHTAPFLTSVPLLSVYLAPRLFDDGAALDRVLTAAGLRRVDRGARLEILRADELVLRGAELDVPVGEEQSTSSPAPVRWASAIRLYGDLLRMGARGPDAAEHLRQTRIGF